jgi:hypothetical protein
LDAVIRHNGNCCEDANDDNNNEKLNNSKAVLCLPPFHYSAGPVEVELCAAPFQIQLAEVPSAYVGAVALSVIMSPSKSSV